MWQETIQGWCFSAEARAQTKRNSWQRPPLCAHSAMPCRQVNAFYVSLQEDTTHLFLSITIAVWYSIKLYRVCFISTLCRLLYSPKCTTWSTYLLFFLSSYLIAHSFGRRMLYPGSVGLLQKAMRPMLQQGQARLIEEVEETYDHSL